VEDQAVDGLAEPPVTGHTPDAGASAEPSDAPLVRLYRLMVRIRAFEVTCRDLYARRVGPGPTGEVTAPEHMPGFVHLYLGEEAVAVGVCACLRTEDSIASTHRGHGHVIAKGGDVHRMMAELYGRAAGYSGGKGGSMHIFAPDIGVLGTNGIVAGGIPHAVGAALAHKLLGRDNVAVAFFGDGASNQGVMFESMNLAALWALPVVFVIENNLFSEWTEYQRLTSGSSLAERARPFGIPSVQVDGNDVLAVRDAASDAVHRARLGRGPTLIEARTYYYGGHFEGEEVFAGMYRNEEEIASWQARDPIARFEAQLTSTGMADRATLDRVRTEEHGRVQDALAFAVEAAPPNEDVLATDVLTGAVRV
jgi:pyruvate dehydrogenase E1 component alpha subunit